MSEGKNRYPVSLFKFRAGNERDLDSLHEDYIWFPTCNELNDPFEGMAYVDRSGVDEALLKAYRTLFNEQHIGEKHPQLSDTQHANGRYDFIRKVFRDSTGIYSASKDHEYLSPEAETDHVLSIMALWGHYADGLRGYCIEYNFDKLMTSLQALNGNGNLNIGSSNVEYVETNLPIISLKTYVEDYLAGDSQRTGIELQKAFATKQAGTWDYEQETRIFVPKGGRYCIDPGCIQAVYLGEKMPDWKKQSIQTSLKAKGLPIRLDEVCIDTTDGMYQLRVRPYTRM